MKNIEEFSGKSSGEWPSKQEKEEDKTERVTGLSRKTREEKVKWNQMTAPRFQTRGRHQTSPASLWGHMDRLMEGQRDKLNPTHTPQSLCYRGA